MSQGLDGRREAEVRVERRRVVIWPDSSDSELPAGKCRAMGPTREYETTDTLLENSFGRRVLDAG